MTRKRKIVQRTIAAVIILALASLAPLEAGLFDWFEGDGSEGDSCDYTATIQFSPLEPQAEEAQENQERIDEEYNAILETGRGQYRDHEPQDAQEQTGDTEGEWIAVRVSDANGDVVWGLGKDEPKVLAVPPDCDPIFEFQLRGIDHDGIKNVQLEVSEKSSQNTAQITPLLKITQAELAEEEELVTPIEVIGGGALLIRDPRVQTGNPESFEERGQWPAVIEISREQYNGQESEAGE